MSTAKEESNYIKALVIRYRMYLGNSLYDFKYEFERIDFAISVLCISRSRGIQIINSNKEVAHLSKVECKNLLQRLNFNMYLVAISDVIYDDYKRLKIKYEKEKKCDTY